MLRQLVLGALVALGVSSGPVTIEGLSAPQVERTAIAEPALLTVYGASDAQTERLHHALTRFAEADLALPPLAVFFHDDRVSCRDHAGLFLAGTDPWQVHICSESPEVVYEHELAHAWIAHNVTDRQRQAFMDLGSYETWNDKGYSWKERGSEGAAVVIQKGISGLPLPPVLSAKTKRVDVDGYQLLVGAPSPRFIAWLDTHGSG